MKKLIKIGIAMCFLVISSNTFAQMTPEGLKNGKNNAKTQEPVQKKQAVKKTKLVKKKATQLAPAKTISREKSVK